MLKAIRPIIKPFLQPFLANFKTALQNPRQSQQLVLSKIIADLAATEYGRSLKIKASDDHQTFAAKAPLVGYDDICQWIERQKQTEQQVMVSEPVLFYEKTSGSSAAAKFIPYTKALKNSFHRMFFIWLCDLLENGPRFKTGKTFISISPAFHQAQTTERGIRVGLDDDSDYLNPRLKILFKPFFILPSSIKHLQNPQNFKRAVAVLLLAEKELEVISIWNPSFLELLLDFIQTNSELLIDDLQRGSVTLENVNFKFERLSGERLSLLKKSPFPWENIWPELKLISCWTNANAKQASERIAAKFPNVFLQGKGLLATEAPVTLPLIAAQGYVPMLSEVFLEFLNERGDIRLLHELETDCEYEIVLTQQGGLYRYRIGDRVRVTHRYEATPCFEFIGRSDVVCDLVGEKLNEQFVRNCLSRLSWQSHFQTLLPVMKDKPHYLLLSNSLTLDLSSGLLPDASLLEAELESLLCEAFHYRNARLLGQLGAARICVALNAQDLYYDYFMSKGIKLGDIKHSSLIANVSDAENVLEKFSLS